jgi:murein DD-endopeptidase MepM/ murein hydrolase activator NlpD
MKFYYQNILAVGIITAAIFSGITLYAETAAPDSIEAQIQAKQAEIQQLEQQINQYQNQVEFYSGQSKTLGNEVSTLKSSERALETTIKSTGTKIQKTNFTINKNINEIEQLTDGISDNRQAIEQSIRSINFNDAQSPIEFFLQRGSLSDFLRDYQDIAQVQNTLRGKVRVMRDKSVQLAYAQRDLTARKEEFQKLSAQLSDQKSIVADQRKQKDTVLKETKNKESEYQKMVKDLQKRVEQIDSEIRDYESKLKFVVNQKSLPKPGSEVLVWPIDNPVLTQFFGKTVDAKKLYVSGSHSGVDFRAAVGTPVYAVADGTVEGTGDTDKTCSKASFGKWIFIRHNNGLSTAYGHLSMIKVSEGQTVTKGEMIGYSGNTGHSTGPHLHLTVYASNGVNGEEGARVTERPSTGCSGKVYRMPLAPVNSYLDPLLYLPKSGATTKSGAAINTNE